MLTDLEVANLALNRLGCGRISSLAEQSKAGRVMNDLVQITRYNLLESHIWDFATKRAAVSNNGNTPAFEFEYEFDRPLDMLRIVSEYNEEKYYVEGDTILANVETLYLRYVFKLEDHQVFSPTFDKAFYLHLAAEASYSLTNDKALKQQLVEEAEFYVERAMSYNSSGSSPRDYEFDIFTDSRL
jgi:hypothetical protein